MRIKTKISLRIDDDLLKILKEYSSNNLTACIESLIWKGLMTDLAEANQQLTLAKSSKNLENNQSNDFEKEMRVATVFLQEMVYKMSLKQGFKEEDLKQLHTMIQKKFN
jgi:hypothetical protein